LVIKVKNTKQKKQENKKIKKNIKSSVSKRYSTTTNNNLAVVFDKHVNCEFEAKDVDATMQTMTKEPYVYHIPVLTGGKGYDEVYTFYSNNFVGKMPSDTKFVRISRTIGKNQVVDELIISFTHDIEIPAMIPSIPPTGKYVELPIVVVMKFKGNKIAYEHIYWDQASLLKQIGLLDNSKELPIIGIEQSKKLQELLSLTTQKKTQKKKAIETFSKAKT
jgi:carboxymethylenebutenolidase